MEDERPDPLLQPATVPRRETEQPKHPAPTQHDQMHKSLPKKKVANALEDFDGDEG